MSVEASASSLQGAALFELEASALGLQGVARDGDRVLFTLVVPAGTLVGQERRIGVDVPPDFPLTPPPGPHVSPPTTHPAGAVHASALGPDFVYWSRPATKWAEDRSTRAWVRHVGSLLAQL